MNHANRRQTTRNMAPPILNGAHPVVATVSRELAGVLARASSDRIAALGAMHLGLALWITELPCQGGPWVTEERRQAWIERYPAEVLSDSGTYQGKVLCFSHPRVQDFYRDLLRRARAVCRERGQLFIGYDDLHLGDDARISGGLICRTSRSASAPRSRAGTNSKRTASSIIGAHTTRRYPATPSPAASSS